MKITKNRIKEILSDIATQDNRATRSPYYYVIKEKETVPTAEGFEDGYWYNCKESGETFDEIEDLIDHIKSYHSDEIDWEDQYGIKVEDLDEDDIDCYGLLDDLNIEAIPYKTITKVADCTPIFFTEKEAKKYLKNQAHNLSDGAYDYIKYCGQSQVIKDIFQYLEESVAEQSE